MWTRLRQLGVILWPGVVRSSKYPAGSLDTPFSSTNFAQQRALSSLVVNKGGFGQLLQPWKVPLSSSSLVDGDESSAGAGLVSGCGGYLIQTRGMKIKGKVKRRCKDCYLIWEEGILHNRCKTHPRHTHRQQAKQWVNQRLMTHATCFPTRTW